MNNMYAIAHLKPGAAIKCVNPKSPRYNQVGILLGFPQPCCLAQFEDQDDPIIARDYIPDDFIIKPIIQTFTPGRFLISGHTTILNATFITARILRVRAFDGYKFMDPGVPNSTPWFIAAMSNSQNQFNDPRRFAYDGDQHWFSLANIAKDYDVIIHEPQINLTVVEKEILDEAIKFYWSST